MKKKKNRIYKRVSLYTAVVINSPPVRSINFNLILIYKISSYKTLKCSAMYRRVCIRLINVSYVKMWYFRSIDLYKRYATFIRIEIETLYKLTLTKPDLSADSFYCIVNISILVSQSLTFYTVRREEKKSIITCILYCIVYIVDFILINTGL